MLGLILYIGMPVLFLTSCFRNNIRHNKELDKQREIRLQEQLYLTRRMREFELDQYSRPPKPFRGLYN